MPQPFGINDSATTELKCFKPLICIHQIGPAQHHAMILHDHRLISGIPEFAGNLFTQIFTAGSTIGSKTDISANIMCLRYNFGVRNNTGNTEGYKCRWMSVNDRRYLRSCLIDGLMKGSSDDGLCRPMTVPSFFTCIISFTVSEPLSTPEGLSICPPRFYP